MKRETNATDDVQKTHIGTRVLVRIPNQAGPFEGIIEEISPEGDYFRVGKRWLPNREGYILSVLAAAKRRKEPIL